MTQWGPWPHPVGDLQVWDPGVASVPPWPEPCSCHPPFPLFFPVHTGTSAQDSSLPLEGHHQPFVVRGRMFKGLLGLPKSWSEVVLAGHLRLLVHDWLPPLPCALNACIAHIAVRIISPEKRKPSGEEGGSQHPDVGRVTFLLCMLRCVPLNASLPVPRSGWIRREHPPGHGHHLSLTSLVFCPSALPPQPQSRKDRWE